MKLENICYHSSIDMVLTGKHLGYLLKEKAISVHCVSVSLGVSNQSVYKWLHGQTLPTLENMYQLSVLLEESIDSIIISGGETEYVLPEVYVRESGVTDNLYFRMD